MEQAAPSSTSSLLKNLLRGTALYSVALFSQRIASFILLPLNTHFLSPADFGVLDLLEQIGIVVSLLLGLNISGALGYFYFKAESREAREKIVGTVWWGTIAISTFAGLVGIAFADPIGELVFGRSDYRVYLLFVFAALPFSLALEALFSYIRVIDRPDIYAWGSLLRVGTTVVMTIALVAVLRFRIFGVLTSSLVAILIPSVYLGVYSLRGLRLRFDRRVFVDLIRFSFPIGIATIAMFVINFGDRFVLRYYHSLTEVGIYAVAYKIGMLITLLHNSFNTYWFSQVYDIGKRDDAEYVISRIFTWLVLALSFALVALIVACRPAVAILVTQHGFEKAALIAPLIAIAYYFRAVGDFFRSILYLEGRSGTDAICTWIGGVVCVAGYYLLIPRYGVWGAAIATIATFLTICVISALWAWRLRPFRLEGIRLFKIGVVSTGLLTLYFLIPLHAAPYLQIAWGLLFITAFPALLWMLRFAEPGETQKLESLIQTGLDRTRLMLRG